MRHTDEQLEHAAQRFTRLADALDPETAEDDDIEDLRDVAGPVVRRSAPLARAPAAPQR